MAEVLDLTYLSDAEKNKYANLGSLVKPGQIAAGGFKMLAFWTIPTVALILLADYCRAQSYVVFADNLVTPAAYVAAVVGIIAAWGSVNERLREQRKKRDEEIKTFRFLIRYDERVRNATRPQRKSARDDGDDYRTTWMTGSYDPERYYQYDKSQRDYMKMTGMDADTYDANVEGREK